MRRRRRRRRKHNDKLTDYRKAVVRQYIRECLFGPEVWRGALWTWEWAGPPEDFK